MNINVNIYLKFKIYKKLLVAAPKVRVNNIIRLKEKRILKLIIRVKLLRARLSRGNSNKIKKVQ